MRTCTHITHCSSETQSYKNILLGFTKQNTTRFFTSLLLSFEHPNVKFVVVITFQNKHLCLLGLLKHERVSMRRSPCCRAGVLISLFQQPLVSPRTVPRQETLWGCKGHCCSQLGSAAPLFLTEEFLSTIPGPSPWQLCWDSSAPLLPGVDGSGQFFRNAFSSQAPGGKGRKL